MKKKLNIDSITNELEGASLFFTKSATPPPPEEPEKPIVEKATNPLTDSPFFEKPATPKRRNVPTIQKNKKEKQNDTVIPRHHDTMTPQYHDTMQPQIDGATIETVRKAVKEFGKEAATHRFTLEEKRAIADIIYTYKSNGMKTSENEITRISVDFVVEDYKRNGENSILHKIIKALNE